MLSHLRSYISEFSCGVKKKWMLYPHNDYLISDDEKYVLCSCLC